MQWRRLTQSEKNTIVRMYESGENMSKIAEFLRTNPTRVSRELDIANCPRRPVSMDLSGKVFGRLTALSALRRRSSTGSVMWSCVCECGKPKVASAADLVHSSVKSCGCLAADTIKFRNWKHGLTSGGQPLQEFSMWASAKSRAKRDNLPFTLKVTDIVIPECCPVFPEIVFEKGRRRRGFHGDSPSLDKLIPEKGYTKENVCVISCRANFIKRDATVTELRRVADWMESELTK